MESMIEAIHKRKSIRTYTDQPIEKEKIEKLLGLFTQNQYGPFGNRVRFELVSLDSMQQKEIKSLGTYGIINGVKQFIIVAVEDGNRAMVDVGYCFEKIVLSATDLKLGTCWMGGTFKEATFSKYINPSENEVVPIVSPIGYAHNKRTLRDRAIRRMAPTGAVPAPPYPFRERRKDWLCRTRPGRTICPGKRQNYPGTDPFPSGNNPCFHPEKTKSSSADWPGGQGRPLPGRFP